MSLDKYMAVNQILVSLFNDIMDMEEKSIITKEFKDVTTNDMHIIEAIGVGVLRNMSTVAATLKVTIGTLTIAINTLVKKGYVNRIRGNKDRRVVFLELTERGKRAYAHHQNFHKQMTQEVLKGLNEEEVNILLKSLNNLSEYFNIKDKPFSTEYEKD